MFAPPFEMLLYYCIVQHVALAPPPPWYAEIAILPPLEENPKCSPGIYVFIILNSCIEFM